MSNDVENFLHYLLSFELLLRTFDHITIGKSKLGKI